MIRWLESLEWRHVGNQIANGVRDIIDVKSGWPGNSGDANKHLGWSITVGHTKSAGCCLECLVPSVKGLLYTVVVRRKCSILQDTLDQLILRISIVVGIHSNKDLGDIELEFQDRSQIFGST